MKKIIWFILFIFFVSFFLQYFVYLSKGFVGAEYHNLLISKNWAETGKLSYESADNVVLSAEAVKDLGEPTNLGNKLNFFLYGIIFHAFGFHPVVPFYATFALYALSAVLFFLAVRRIFGLRIGFVSTLLFSVMPFSFVNSNITGNNEWAFFFLMSAFLCYFWPKEKKVWSLVLTGLLLGLSAAAKNSFFVAFPAFLFLEIFDHWKEKQSAKIIILKSMILLASFLVIAAPFIFVGGNDYLTELFGVSRKYNPSFSDFGHIFPDAYTFHYDKDNFLQNHIANLGNASGGQFQFYGDQSSFLEEYGIKVGFFRAEIVTRLYSIWIYIKGFLSLVVFGGMFAWFLIIWGAVEMLKRKNYRFLFFSVVYFFSWFSLLVFLKTSNYSQLPILAPPFLALAGFGLCEMAKTLAISIQYPKWSNKISALIVVLFLISFFQISQWGLREIYANSVPIGKANVFTKENYGQMQFSKDGVVAVGFTKNSDTLMAYYLDGNFLFFAPETIRKLISKKKLDQVFERYNVTGFVGYDAELSGTIDKETGDKLKNY